MWTYIHTVACMHTCILLHPHKYVHIHHYTYKSKDISSLVLIPTLSEDPVAIEEIKDFSAHRWKKNAKSDKNKSKFSPYNLMVEWEN